MKPIISWSKVALFFSGSFFCGAVSHLFLIVQGSPMTPMGFHLGTTVNWLLGAFDLGMTETLYATHRWIERKNKRVDLQESYGKRYRPSLRNDRKS